MIKLVNALSTLKTWSLSYQSYQSCIFTIQSLFKHDMITDLTLKSITRNICKYLQRDIYFVQFGAGDVEQWSK